MNIVPPSTADEWHGFLRAYSTEFPDSPFMRRMAADGRADQFLSAAQRSAGWLGFEPASADDIAAAEQRLGVRLPPAYRNFLLTSNGWNTISYAVDLLPIAEVGWFPDVEPELIRAWEGTELLDEYGSVLERSLVVSMDDGGAGQYLFLHAAEVADDGEWTAYEWWPGDGEDPYRYAGFGVLIADLWKQAREN
ncbi:SMI1/KNR4 family protein [Nocardia sp. BMG111209]|uniref:SMI1/KNR4 family protein n=1 Tax=Nocardia sp. BMG111209 TaxID=1160137 RepID=UPI00035F9091|nr:SMI1/KNR4 family protein [Nocardia sp. BMG111209]